MKILVLGDTRFLGRHVVTTALARGHEVATFMRGGNADDATAAQALIGDRDPRIGVGLAANTNWQGDAVIDLSGYVPRLVDAAAAALQARIRRYLFVSSASVYAEVSRPGVDEDAAVATLSDASSEDIPRHYGALKAAWWPWCANAAVRVPRSCVRD